MAKFLLAGTHPYKLTPPELPTPMEAGGMASLIAPPSVLIQSEAMNLVLGAAAAAVAGI